MPDTPISLVDAPPASVPTGSSVPPLRSQVWLNGEWDEGGPVPNYRGERLHRRTYRRSVVVPDLWSGKHVTLDFDAIAYSAEVFVHDTKLTSHVGGWLPLSVDVTSLARPGRSFDLRVDVAGMLQPPTFVEGWERWPLGAQQLHGDFGGIVGDVFLRARGDVSITDAFIRTSFRQQRIAVDFTVVNSSGRGRKVVLRSLVTDPAGKPTLALPELALELAPGERRVVTLAREWRDAKPWWPDQPVLHHLRSAIVEGDNEIDAETRRFGFREFWTEGRHFRLNGVRVNLRGDYCGFGQYWPMHYQTRENLADTYRLLRDRLHFNVLRWHMRPAPRYAYEIADETGMMIVAESALYGRPGGAMPDEVRRTYVANGRDWLSRWIPSLRNHPSIVLWSPVNEMGPKYPHHQSLSVDELKQFGATVRQLDPTRPLVYHGNPEVVEDTQNHHYPMAGNFGTVTQSIYSWKPLIHPDVPTGFGEFLQTSPTAPHKRLPKFARTAMAEWNRWLLCVWPRGLRFLGAADFRPKMFFWLHGELDSRRGSLAANAFAPVALFDFDYDDLGIVPLVDEDYPALPAGLSTRRLVLYNDDYRDELVTVELELRRDGATLVAIRGEYRLNPGFNERIACELDPGAGPAGQVDLVRRTFKQGRLCFEESSRFIVPTKMDGRAILRFTGTWSN